jgi:hypothetical protein
MDSFTCNFNRILIWMRDTMSTLETDTDTIAWNTSGRYQRLIGMECSRAPLVRHGCADTYNGD